MLYYIEKLKRIIGTQSGRPLQLFTRLLIIAIPQTRMRIIRTVNAASHFLLKLSDIKQDERNNSGMANGAHRTVHSSPYTMTCRPPEV